ncbi:hypothetical protein O3M35_002870 [Rhynocoris fuscipes]|uniref:Cytochrome P450 n=1 Tax=Rhynocoris fuscipes TaxID=488301 RepID=A0AAW1CUM9_9HEMI
MWLLLCNPVILSISLFCVIVLLLYYNGTRTYGYWKKRQVPYIAPDYPYLGNLYDVIFSFKCIHEKQIEIYNYFKNEKYGGIYFLQKPILFLKDPELIETILIKDFAYFYNRSEPVSDAKKEPHLVNLIDQQWKSLRAKLSPTFTSGKLKSMHSQLIECADSLIKYLDKYVNTGEPIELRETMARFTTDTIGCCFFGLNMNALNDPESEIRRVAKDFFKPSAIGRFLAALRDYSPELYRIAQKLFRSNNVSGLTKLFVPVLFDTMEYREKNNIVRNDFVQLMMELKKEDLRKQKEGLIGDDQVIMDDATIASNALVFFAAGFDTTATTLSNCLYELSVHEDIQEEAYKHIVSVLEKHAGEPSYEAIKDMTYIHNVLAETLRMHQPASETRRIAGKDYHLPGTSLIIEKGTPIVIPFHALHYDPQYFPEPDKFKPERFSEAKKNIIKGTYLPFGDGPRICIGKRFAEVEIELALIKLLLNYKFKLNPKTKSPLVHDPTSFLLVPLGGLWVNIEKRN